MPETPIQSSLIGQRQSRALTYWVADFETTTDPNDCRVWLWGLISVDGEDFSWGNSIDSFFEALSPNSRYVYFHNLGFDGVFLLDWLLRNGFVYCEGSRKLLGKQFKCVIDKMGKYYSITVGLSDTVKIEFRDSLKKLPMTVKRIAESFNLTLAKGEIDYHSFRPVGYLPSDEELEYLYNDVAIVAKALGQQLNSGMKRLTIGSDSLFEYKKLMGGDKVFRKMFPVLPTGMDSEIRKAYRGGWTYPDKRFRGKVQHRKVRVYDVNSLYPHVMRKEVLPYGEPVYTDGIPEISDKFPLFVTTITFTAKIKPNHVPCIQLKKNRFLAVSEYVDVIDEPLTLSCTSVDLELWSKHYDIDILSYEGSWMFKGVRGFFDEYIDKWMDVKMTTRGGLREIAKLHLNSLYGKFASNPDATGKFPVLDVENNRIKLVLGDEESKSPVYTPMGVFITAYARSLTINAAQDNYDIFAYADTDSLHLLTHTDPASLDIDSKALGAWKFENEFNSALYVRAKCYTEKSDRCNCLIAPPFASHGRGCGFETHIAGLPDYVTDQVTYEDFWSGHEFRGKLTPKIVPGGVVLTDTSWTLTDDLLGVD